MLRATALSLRLARAGLVLVLASAALGLGAASAANAQPRAVVFRFLAPADPVDGYRFYLFDESEGVEDMHDIGFVMPDGQGVATAVLALDATRSYAVEMTAYNAVGESSRSNEIQLQAEAPADPLSVDRMLTVLTPGKHIVTLTGSGFTRKPKLKFENGQGKPPKAKVLRVLDENTLEVQLKVKHKNLYGRATWDMRVRIKGGEEIVVPAALTVDPL
jgi:hypothetical protein